ncbi:MAG: hypothetical protein COS76_01390 [Candidatus Portnoybacteria bacterium CG06_land_8_20_14_3_00_39_12]|uniref:Adenylate kinase n=2 Tax=Candidatus Portnoyibacteriota TaxID=1817913 RepID=A0A2M8KH64_9BACT|nr:MAG: hypothetical protein COS76_01390 [Candidatus Portnoybacteria bacterium CG06_land_8_20_14_3_00_39_12]PJE59255.1 MAG: hypothetical protein COU83_00025 [Candidatus Portnoybacteria bacterium CG10_big_fil_rev_8_21_14_0_10_40_22]
MPSLKKLLVIFIGPPGSGKGTQASMLAEKLGLTHIGSSEIIREKLPTLSGEEKELVEKPFNDGGLIPSDVITKWVIEKLEKVKSLKGKGIVLDGSPRMLPEAESLNQYLKRDSFWQEYILFLDIKADESIWRREHRRVCANCRYALPYTPENAKLTVCPKCGGQLMKRADETALEKRWQVYEEQTLPVINYFREQGLLKEINGSQSIEKVHEDVVRALNID